jgi:hypothetical protein
LVDKGDELQQGEHINGMVKAYERNYGGRLRYEMNGSDGGDSTWRVEGVRE